MNGPLSEKRVAPSILAADYGRLSAQVADVLDAGARVIHVDVMDGHFVPPITVGPLIVDALREQVHEVDGALDVHLMIEAPERHVAAFARAGADSITIHWEATPHVHYALNSVHEAGCLSGLAINPATPPSVVAGVADIVDTVLCMTVNPGWGGQTFIESSPGRVAELSETKAPGSALEVDGGINEDNAPSCADAGATLFVAGSSVFGAADPADAYRRLATVAGAA